MIKTWVYIEVWRKGTPDERKKTTATFSSFIKSNPDPELLRDALANKLEEILDEKAD